MNVIARLEYELANYDSAVNRFNHYTTRTPPALTTKYIPTFMVTILNLMASCLVFCWESKIEHLLVTSQGVQIPLKPLGMRLSLTRCQMTIAWILNLPDQAWWINTYAAGIANFNSIRRKSKGNLSAKECHRSGFGWLLLETCTLLSLQSQMFSHKTWKRLGLFW